MIAWRPSIVPYDLFLLPKVLCLINAGLKNVKDVDELAKYAMLRTFSHEFTHFLEKYNPEWYNEFRKMVFETLTSRGGCG